jgi:hypothetical protein
MKGKAVRNKTLLTAHQFQRIISIQLEVGKFEMIAEKGISS